MKNAVFVINSLISGVKPNRNKALMLAKREVGVLVRDAVLLEGINFTLPEITMLLEGVTVGGHKLRDQQIAVNQGSAWRYLFDAAANQEFTRSLAFVNALHAIEGKEEALVGAVSLGWSNDCRYRIHAAESGRFKRKNLKS